MKNISAYTDKELIEVGRKTILSSQKSAERDKVKNKEMRELYRKVQSGEVKIVEAK